MGFFKDAMKKRIALDVLAGGNNLTNKQLSVPVSKAVLIQGDQRGHVTIQVPFASKSQFILDGIEWEESATRSAGKAAVGAIVGSLAGPVGTIAGAAIGGRKKDNSKAFVYLINPETNAEVTIHIRCDQKTYTEISSMI
ncbi:hypothetical protein [Cytobacillus oceanisediminis]|uniref:Uncharacterized protein n=1 Tax=Cytobacillus oceanisediminis 2691 TaxID=1196031 RepID=A0A160MAR0_9BACI|nr:hypothetical protein [Cytobacillus oceanisediminis]AND39634.1 hypothetical protein A361_10955 [Cytobacillus oceanisediminis 2691]